MEVDSTQAEGPPLRGGASPKLIVRNRAGSRLGHGAQAMKFRPSRSPTFTAGALD